MHQATNNGDCNNSDVNSIHSNDFVFVQVPLVNAKQSTTKPIKVDNADDLETRMSDALNFHDVKQSQMTDNQLQSCEYDASQTNTIVSLDTIELQNSSLFFNIKYLGCASVNAPKSETEIIRIIAELDNQEAHIEVTMSIPNNVNECIKLFDTANQLEIATYKMYQVLFVVRGTFGTASNNCFAFTTCHGDSMDNLIFPCHVFRCELNEAVSKILYSFWLVFKREQMLKQQEQMESSVTKSIESSANSFQIENQSSRSIFAQRVFKYVNGDDINNQHQYRIYLDIREDMHANGQQFTSVPKDKDYFKLKRNLNKIIYITIQKLSNGESRIDLDIQRCFGVLLSAGRNCSVADMQLLETKSMGKTAGHTTTGLAKKQSGVSQEYQICAYWNPREPQYAILNEETQKNVKIFLTIAIDIVIDCVLEPIRFLIETKCKVFSQTEKFWSFPTGNSKQTRFQEDFYVQLKTSISSVGEYNLHSVHSYTELLRKLNQQDIELKKHKQLEENGLNDDNEEDNENMIFSGMGIVSKDFVDDSQLLEWTDLMQKWRKNYEERPRNLQDLVNNGIPETLRGEVWQLLAGCQHDDKSMHESYRLLLFKESSCEQVILRDINRTFPGHAYFQDENGQQSLYKLSKAYSIYDEEIGYCQGLSFLIATLLLHMPEEQSFNLLCKIMFNYKLRDIYKTNFESLHLRFYQFEQIVREMIPALYEHFVDLNIETHMYASQWFLTLYTSKFPLYMVYRIIDLFLFYGFNVLLTIGIALLKMSAKDLLMLDFEGILKYFRLQLPKKYRNEENFKEFMHIWQTQVHYKVTNKKILKHEKNYELFKRLEKEKEDPQLRSDKENKTLQQQIRRLEQENDDIANEFINYQVDLNKKYDELKDKNEIMELELHKLKQDQQFKYSDYNDTISKYQAELENIKSLYRSNIDNYEYSLKQREIVKHVNQRLSTKLADFKIDTKRELDKFFGQIESLNVNPVNGSIQESIQVFKQGHIYLDASDVSKELPLGPTGSHVETTVNDEDRIRDLELQLASAKLELVNEKCLNQEYVHKMKQLSTHTNEMLTNPTNRWFNKTLNQFKDATSHVVQKVNK